MFRIITIDELLNILEGYNHKELHVHHTWKPSHKDFTGDNGMALQRGMRDYHVNTRGWNDIGQHVTLLPNGLFITGRDFGKTPASITGYNEGAFACETLGNFDIGNDVLQGAQKDSLIRLARYFDSKGRYVRFHRENSSKTCPGTSIDKEVFMREVRGANLPATSKPPEAVAGVFFQRDEAAGRVQIRELQEELNAQFNAGLAVDNIPGPKTLAACPTLKQGARGNITRWVQRKLNELGFNSGAADGIFGPATLAAVKAFQGAKGLVADGIIGKNTWPKLLGL